MDGPRGKDEVVALLRQMGAWMRASGDFRRSGAYRRAAQAIAARDDFDALVARGRLREVPGVGESIERTITRFVKHGERPAFLEGEPPPAPEIEIPEAYREAPFQGLPDLHCHTTWSDGTLDIDEVVAFARKLGEPAIGISDHSGSLFVARGLKPDRVREQWAEIERLQAETPDVLILRGTECDILRNGALDHPEELLKEFDHVVGSLHSQLRLPEKEQTARVLAALDSPHLTVLGHPTTRVPGRRPRANLDLDKVFAKAADRGIAMEVNGNPGRIDLDAKLARQALEAGCKLSLASDAHSAEEMIALAMSRFIAEEAGATVKDLVNADVLRRAKERRRVGKD